MLFWLKGIKHISVFSVLSPMNINFILQSAAVLFSQMRNDKLLLYSD